MHLKSCFKIGLISLRMHYPSTKEGVYVNSVDFLEFEFKLFLRLS